MIRSHISRFFLLAAVIVIMGVACTPSRQGNDEVKPVGTLAAERPSVTTPTTTPLPTPTPPPLPAALEVMVDDTLVLDTYSPQSPFVIHFNQAMDSDSTTAPLHISPHLPGVTEWDEGHQTLTFTPETRFVPGRDYTFTLDDALQSAAGMTLVSTLTWQIHVTDAPHVVERTPEEAAGVNRRPQFQIKFDRPMDKTSVANALTVLPDIPVDVRWQDDALSGDVLIIEPLEAMLPAVRYRFTIGAEAADQAGTTLAVGYSWQYQLSRIVNRVAWPSAVQFDGPIVVHFNYAIDPQSVTLLLSPAVAGDITWDETYTQLTFAPTVPLPGNTRYTVEFGDGLRDSQGDALPLPDANSFTVVSAINDVSPNPNTTVHPAVPIQISFKRPMDEESTKAALHIEPHTPGYLEWHENTLEFHPINERLAAEATYEVTLAATATDIDGHPILSTDYTWTFHTGEMTNLVTFGEGEHTQVVYLDGPRAVQFGYPSTPMDITFELRPLDLAQWLTAGAVSGGTVIQSWQVAPDPEMDDYVTTQETTIPAGVPSGAYVLSARTGEQIEDELVVFLTRHALTLHQDDTQTVAWVTGIDGTPVDKAEIEVYANGQLVSTGPTDENGLYYLDTADTAFKVLARVGDEVTVSKLGDAWRSQSASSSRDYAIHLFTNRPVYRPGQSVFFRAIIRQESDATLSVLPAGTEVTVQVYGPEDEAIQTAVLTSSHFGTVHGEVALAETAAVGEYRLVLTVGDESQSQHFDVAVDADPDYTVTVSTDAPIYARGDEINITVDVRDALGQPLSNARVIFKAFESENTVGCFSGPSFDSNWFYTYIDEQYGRTDANGRASLTLAADLSYNTHAGPPHSNVYHSVWAMNAAIEVEEEEIASGFVVYEVSTAAQQIVDMAFGSRVKSPGQEFMVTAQVTNMMGQPASNRSLTLSLMAFDTHEYAYSTPVQGVAVASEENGRIQAPFTIQQPGQYELQLAGYDAWGNKFETRQPIYAYSPGLTGHYRPISLQIEADQERYVPGETARLIIRSDFDGAALLTFSRGQIYRQEVVQLTAPLTVVDAPVTADDGPNLFVTIHAWDEQDTPFDRETYNIYASVPDTILRTAATQLKVDDPAKIAHITIVPHQESYAPGQTAEITVRVTNYKDEPISAELSLAMLDDAIFGQYSAHTSPLLRAFYDARSNKMSTYHSMAPSRYLIYDFFGGCGCGGGWWGEYGDLTSDFTDESAWFPALVTDANGEATVTLTMPAQVGRWRFTARAVTADTQISETTLTIPTQ